LKERTLVQNIKQAIKTTWPRAFVVKLADRFTRGLPDLLVLLPGVVVFLEAKTPSGRLSAIQRSVHEEIERAGGLVAVVTSVEDALSYIRNML